MQVSSGRELRIHVAFHHADGDIDVRLHDVEYEQVLATANRATDDEEIIHRASRSAAYAVEVYGYEGATNRYALDIEVR